MTKIATTSTPENRAPSANDSDESTVHTDDEEFSSFISSRWMDRVEIGLVINYPLPHTQYLLKCAPNQVNTGREEEETASTSALVGTVIRSDNNDINEEDCPNVLPPLSISTVLQESSIAPIFDGTQWAGTRVWKAAIYGLEFLLRERQHQFQKNKDSSFGSLLELGCGLGVPGMIWKQVLRQQQEQGPSSSAESSRVVLTDRDSLVPQLKANVSENFKNDTSIEAMALDWSKEGITSLLRHEQDRCGSNKKIPIFDICLNCDCVYEPLYGREAWVSLANVLSEIALVSPSTLLVTSLERRNGDNVEGFLEKLESSGTVETPIRRVVRHDEDPHHVIEIYVTKGKCSV